jgi:two-component system C4-dicarboxylate transport response regulator DctD
MPGVNGIELLKTLIVRDIRLPVVMITGRIDRTSRRWAQEAGAAIVLQKPFTGDELFEAIRTARLVGAERAIRRIPNCPAPVATR